MGNMKPETIPGFLILDNLAQNAEEGHAPLTAERLARELSERPGVWAEG